MAIGSNYYQYGTPRSNPRPNNYRLYSFPNAKGRNAEKIIQLTKIYIANLAAILKRKVQSLQTNQLEYSISKYSGFTVGDKNLKFRDKPEVFAYKPEIGLYLSR